MLKHCNKASRAVQTDFPVVPSSAGYHLERPLMVSTRKRPRSAGMPGLRGTGTVVADEDGQLALVKGEDQPDERAACSGRVAGRGGGRASGPVRDAGLQEPGRPPAVLHPSEWDAFTCGMKDSAFDGLI